MLLFIYAPHLFSLHFCGYRISHNLSLYIWQVQWVKDAHRDSFSPLSFSSLSATLSWDTCDFCVCWVAWAGEECVFAHLLAAQPSSSYSSGIRSSFKFRSTTAAENEFIGSCSHRQWLSWQHPAHSHFRWMLRSAGEKFMFYILDHKSMASFTVFKAAYRLTKADKGQEGEARFPLTRLLVFSQDLTKLWTLKSKKM